MYQVVRGRRGAPVDCGYTRTMPPYLPFDAQTCSAVAPPSLHRSTVVSDSSSIPTNASTSLRAAAFQIESGSIVGAGARAAAVGIGVGAAGGWPAGRLDASAAAMANTAREAQELLAVDRDLA